MSIDYKKYVKDRDRHTNAILTSKSSKKIILAGPGTGKSYLFQKVCEKNNQGESKNLALSFINELVDDLAADLNNLATVQTLHSFALGKLPNSKGVHLNLGNVISDDLKYIEDKEVDYSYLLCNLEGDAQDLDFYSKRRKYYGFYSPNCSVYTLVKTFEAHKDKIPERAQILIDEFQDFNKLETRLIDLLAEKSPVLFAGDDDQSLYQTLKYAHPEEIRSRWASRDYDKFELPYCIRCPRVILDAYASVITKAKSEGHLQERVDKRYEYFADEEKDKVSENNSKIRIKKNVYLRNVAYNIKKEVEELLDPRDKKQPKSILIICPYSKHIPDLELRLRSKGFRNIMTSYKDDVSDLIEGVKLLLKDSSCNLGWRVVAEHYFVDDNRSGEFTAIVKTSHDDTSKKFMDLLSVADRKMIKSLIANIRKLTESKRVADDDRNNIYNFLGYNLELLALSKLSTETNIQRPEKSLLKDIPIKITTIAGSKGLTQDYTFLVNFDDKYLLEKKDDGSLEVTDQCIHNFLVALTRAKVRTHIFTTEATLPTFASWMGVNNYEEI